MAEAKVAGPGAYARRTDVGGQPVRDLPDADYGEAQEYRETQKAAPLNKAGDAPNIPVSAGGGTEQLPEQPAELEPDTPVPGMFDAGDPSIPLTAGAPIGAGPNMIEGLPGGMGEEFTPVSFAQALEPYVAADGDGILSEVVAALTERGIY